MSRERVGERIVRTEERHLGPLDVVVAAFLCKRLGALGRPSATSIERVQVLLASVVRVQVLLASVVRVVLVLLDRGLASQLTSRDADSSSSAGTPSAV
jgi:hypothetical protein